MRGTRLAMRRLIRGVFAGATVALATAMFASAASAATFFVNGSTGNNANSCLSAASPCETINGAVAKARLSPDTATIDVAAGTYTEDLLLLESGDSGLTIDGAGSTTVVRGVNTGPTVVASEHNEGPVTIKDLRIVNPPGDTFGALVSKAPYSISNVVIEMQNASSGGAALVAEKTAGTFDHVTIGGAWTGLTLVSVGSTTITNSTFKSNGSGIILVPGVPGGHNDLIRNSTVQASSEAVHNNILAVGVDLTLDSSLALGGNPYAIEWVQTASPTLSSILTVAGSTVDAGALGTADAGVNAIFAVSEGPAGVPARVQIEGSILLEQQQAAAAEVKDPLTIACTNSDVPSQNQVQSGTEGAIECASGVNGNTHSAPASLFVAPGTNYQLNPSSSAVDSVPAGAITLPFGLTPSITDLLGNTRAVDGNGDCIAVQDKGALELRGHSAACPVPPVSPTPIVAPPRKPPVAGAITALTISPSAFSAAPSGATSSRAASAARKKYGATITYLDSQAATTTFTVLVPMAGRMHGKACTKPGRANRHGTRCTFYKALGSFTHADAAGANSLRFSGRVRGKKLGKGSYRLQAIPANAAGNGAAVTKSFTIK